MTFLEIRQSASYYLDDLNFGYFTPTQVGIWANNAQKRLQKRLIKAGQNYYTKCAQTTLVANQNDYVLPDDFKDLNRLEIVMSGIAPNESLSTLTPITVNQQDLVMNGAGTPYWYFIKRNRLVLQPAPQLTLPLRMLYTYECADMVLDTDVPDVPDSYHEYLALLTAEDGFIKDGRSSALLEKKIQEFEMEIDSDAAERNVDRPRSIVQTGSNDVGGGYF